MAKSARCVRVSYLELVQKPAPIGPHPGRASISAERLAASEYLDLYRRIGGPLRWDQRLKMPSSELISLLASQVSQIYVLRDTAGQALGFCEFERHLPQIELKNFGLIAAAQGKGLGAWLLRTALHQEWRVQPQRIWLHTDDWDHPAALRVYQDAGLRIYQVRDEPPAKL